MARQKRTTIYDIARHLNLSPGTISKIMNGKGQVPPATREKVLNYVKEINFVANINARNLKSSRSYTIGIVFHDLALFGLEHPFFSTILQAFKNYVEAKGYEIVFIVDKLGDRQLSIVEWCANKKVDGVLMITGNKASPDLIALTESTFPTVSVDNIMPKLTTVISNDQQGIELGIQHFIQLGFKTIAAFTGPLYSRAYSERMRAFKEILFTRNLDVPREWIFECQGFSYQSAFEKGLEWIKTWKKVPEAIFCFSDNLAMGLIHALQKEGYKVPKDISVIGFDDAQFSILFNPPLTTIRQNKKAIAETAGKILLDMIEQGVSSPITHVYQVPVELVVRESTQVKKH
jgi:LacI family transcriptional regulator